MLRNLTLVLKWRIEDPDTMLSKTTPKIINQKIYQLIIFYKSMNKIGNHY